MIHILGICTTIEIEMKYEIDIYKRIFELYRRADNQAYPALTNIVGLYWLFLWEMFIIIVHTYTLMPIYPVTADLVENCCWNVWRTGSIQEDNIL